MATIIKKAICLGCLLALSSIVTWVAPVQAQGGFAMSGSFNAQKLELPQGTSLRTPDIYVVIFNNSDQDLNVKITTNVPYGVSLVLTADDFPLAANSQKKIEVGIDVGIDALPGDYKIGIVAEPYKEGTQGIQIVGAAGQEADLTITGESSLVDITTVSPNGDPVPAMIVLFRDYEHDDFEIARIDSGILKLSVSPGNYIARAYIAGNQLAEENFAIATDEEKTITLEVKTVYFEGFEIVPNFQKDTENLVMTQVICTVNNLLEALTDVKVNLLVGSQTQQENITIINFTRLEIGKQPLSYNYIPADGWQQGEYTFILQLEINGQVYTTSQSKGLNIDETGKLSSTGVPAVTPSESTESTTPTMSPDEEAGTSMTGFIIAGAAIVGILVVITVIVLARRRK
jgi:hypothetical protein